MLSTLSLLLPLAAPTFQGEGEAVSIAFSPAPGTSLEKSWTYNHELLSEQMMTGVDGKRESIPMQMRVAVEHEVLYIDEYQELGPEFPTRMRRFFTGGVRRSRLGPNGDPNQVGELTRGGREFSPLNGLGVQMTWVPEEGHYGYCYDGDENEESYLGRLRGDTDLRALLPGREVKVGESWEVSPGDIADLLEPGGYIPFNPRSRATDRRLSRTIESGIGSRLGQICEGSHAGRLLVTLAGVREENGDRLADLSLEFDCRYVLDQLDSVMSGRTAASIRAGIAFTEAKLSVELSGKGAVQWNLSDGHVQGYSADLRQRVTQRLSQTQGEGSPVREQHFALTGSVVYAMTVTPKDAPPAPIGASAEDAADDGDADGQR